MGSMEHPLSSLAAEGSVEADGEGYGDTPGKKEHINGLSGCPGGSSGGTILLFLRTLNLSESAVLSSIGGNGSFNGAGGGGGGRVHFHWFNIPTGDIYQPIASVKGSILTGFVFILK